MGGGSFVLVPVGVDVEVGRVFAEGVDAFARYEAIGNYQHL